MPKNTIGLAIIMQNEESHLPAAISQFYHAVVDIVVVDGGSEDESVKWANRMGARVIHHPFDNDFSAQKNFAISKLETDWIYLHDPDERLEPALLEMIPVLASSAGQRSLMDIGIIPDSEDLFDCFGIARRNFIDGAQTEIYPDYQYRLFKNYCKCEGKVHEKIIGFKNRTEIDFDRNSLDTPSRFNILHYKSSERQKIQDKFYDAILKESSK